MTTPDKDRDSMKEIRFSSEGIAEKLSKGYSMAQFLEQLHSIYGADPRKRRTTRVGRLENNKLYQRGVRDGAQI